MNQSQREHIATVVASTRKNLSSQAVNQQDRTIRDSWLRCIELHGLEPGRMQEARILPWTQLREHRDRMEEFCSIARHTLKALYQQIAGLGYVVMLSDAQGVTVDYLGDRVAEVGLRRAGLYLGAQWSEAWMGTCGVGTSLATGRALTVHQADHFDAAHIALTCSAVPLFDPQGQLIAVLDISALSSPQAKSSQLLALQLARLAAQQIENAWLAHCHRNHWILKLSPTPAAGINPDFLIAVDAAGRLSGCNQRARRMLEKELASSADNGIVLGRSMEHLFCTSLDSLPHWLASASGDQKTLALCHSGTELYASVQQPAARPVQQVPLAAQALPAPLAALCGGDRGLQQQLQRAARLLNARLNLLVHGETGCGKEYFAKAFHQSGERGNQPFVAVNCAAIPAELIESELFGHLPGSFSGAGNKGRRGLIQEADGGTLFLDEIGDMPLKMQTRLLRVLAEQEVLPVGASRPVAVNIRVISASHHALDQLVEQGRFRADLFYRLQGAQISLPPLRQRSDLNWLIDNMLSTGMQLSAAARQRLHQHGWPGNLRELSNALAYATAICDGECIEADDLPDGMGERALAEHAQCDRPELPQEALRLIQHLRAARWNHSATARQLGISRMTLYRRMQRFGIVSPRQQ
ncbi:sigma-54-dependent Fis family transcriptional regulator [Erwinia tasmaniensis]|uniref:Transcriptional regulator n=1 Tax=Erwinia tasmaniensis (strain DSM 17950 / CFBP 7177 / CIP 109463 / NCPPB 4357 / Et1/99) TaxID=465817 RepID=B2VFK3_ERWT9|nr:sigma-54-dependent Fis family transcriptional regulator [Erwinia tasmaniensis]CAO96416.1 Putative transcriptional regulator [Erwinia tasmaniensis Et1/99]